MHTFILFLGLIYINVNFLIYFYLLKLINWINNEGKIKLNQYLSEMVNNLLINNNQENANNTSNSGCGMSFLSLSKQFQTFYAIATVSNHFFLW
jgi:hypothetical protein